MTNLQNYLGARAHFVIISEDKTDFIHAHPVSKNHDDSSSSSRAVKTIKTKAARTIRTSSPSEVSAHTAFPRGGLYKIWAQFQRGGRIIIVFFIVNVAEDKIDADLQIYLLDDLR